MRKFGLIGYPLGHSFSSKYFTEKFEREKISGCSYENFPLEHIGDFPELIRSNNDLYGLNVTIPWKTEILKYVDETEQAVKEIGAANVLKINRKNGRTRICGFNSDVVGIKDSVITEFPSGGGHALILGTGGSSRAVRYALQKLGFRITLVSRSGKPGIATYSDLDSEVLNRTDLIVNTTPLGMFPDVESKPELNYHFLGNHHVLFDLVYNPEITTFLRLGRERGCKIITGLRMLYSQAERSWEIWNDPAI
jgi:shikimate dehydrogenase